MAESIRPQWSRREIILFRFFALFFLTQSLPLDAQWFTHLAGISADGLQYNDIFNLAHFSPDFFNGLDTFANWGVVLLIALLGTIAWSFYDKDRTEYNNLYYWVRVFVRYRLAIAIIAYGVIKLFPIQSPYPSLSNLNTNYGDFNRWKLFSSTLGIVPNYQSFLGLVEILFGLLLFSRKTASIGAFLIVIFTGNVFMSNIAYEGGEYVYSFYLISLALFLLVFDLPRIINLTILQKPTLPNKFRPQLHIPWQKATRLAVKSFIIFFFVFFYGFKTRQGLREGLTRYPKTPGLSGVAGIYNVSEFKIGNNVHPYSQTDPVRWQDVVFETWNTLSIKSKRPVVVDSRNVTRITTADGDRNYEFEGSGERHYYSYSADTVKHTLTLHNRNPNYPNDNWVLHYENEGKKGFRLSGINAQNDSVHIVLDRLDKKYLVEEAAKLGRRGKLTM